MKQLFLAKFCDSYYLLKLLSEAIIVRLEFYAKMITILEDINTDFSNMSAKLLSNIF